MTAAVLFGHGPSSNVRAITRRVVDTLEIGAPLEQRRPDGLADAGNDELTVDAALTPSTSANAIDLRTATRHRCRPAVNVFTPRPLFLVARGV